MAQVYHNITELIGNTPIVKLNSLVPEGAADVYVKLEAFNPGSSVKDRIALSMIETAEQEGLIQPGATIVEATSAAKLSKLMAPNWCSLPEARE